MPKVMIVDDHPVIRFAIRVLLERGGYEIAAETDNGVEAISLIQKIKPDIVILDIFIPKLDGFEVIHRIRQLGLPTKILVLSSQPPAHMVTRCMQAGASGFVSKEKDLSEVIDAVKVILNNNTYFPSQNFDSYFHQAGLLNELDTSRSLSNRELMVLKQLVMGKSNNDIADSMLLSPKTISTYKVRLFRKLSINSLTDLIEFAKRNSLI